MISSNRCWRFGKHTTRCYFWELIILMISTDHHNTVISSGYTLVKSGLSNGGPYFFTEFTRMLITSYSNVKFHSLILNKFM